MSVVISRALRLSLGDENAQDLAQKFHDYKVSQTISFGVNFGRDKLFGAPAEARSRQLWHVHLEDEFSTAAWDRIYENYVAKGYTQDNYTSNKILVYGYAPSAPKSPYFLLRILSPDGHAMMNDDMLMKAVCYLYDSELMDYKQRMPCDDWIIVR